MPSTPVAVDHSGVLSAAAGDASVSRAGPGGSAQLSDIVSIWPALVTAIGERSRVAAASWEGAQPVSLVDGILTISVPSEGQAKSIAQSKRDLMLRTMLIEDHGIAVQVVASAGPGASASSASDEPSPDDPDVGEGGLSGVDLAVKSLGATKIGEIEET